MQIGPFVIARVLCAGKRLLTKRAPLVGEPEKRTRLARRFGRGVVPRTSPERAKTASSVPFPEETQAVAVNQTRTGSNSNYEWLSR
jgi:hypothetical protein